MVAIDPTWRHEWTDPGSYSFAKDFHTVHFYAGATLVGALTFQDGPVAEQGLNGTINEEVIAALVERLTALNKEPYESDYNARAISYLRSAGFELKARTNSRKMRQVEGTPTP